MRWSAQAGLRKPSSHAPRMRTLAQLGIGFPAYTAGTLSYIGTIGLEEFVGDCPRPAKRYGTRFKPSLWLLVRREAVGDHTDLFAVRLVRKYRAHSPPVVYLTSAALKSADRRSESSGLKRIGSVSRALRLNSTYGLGSKRSVSFLTAA
jgi:hypothetical protein